MGVLLTAAVMAVLWWPWFEVAYRSTAPASVAYEDGSAHHLGLVHEWTLSGRHSYTLVIGRDPGLSYGHRLDVDPELAGQGVASTAWTEKGVRVRFRLGHELLVPARFFLHGR